MVFIVFLGMCTRSISSSTSNGCRNLFYKEALQICCKDENNISDNSSALTLNCSSLTSRFELYGTNVFPREGSVGYLQLKFVINY